MTAILVHIGDQHVRIRLEPVEHAIAVMGIDVDVGDAPQTVLATQVLDRHAAIVEHAEAGGAAARCVMQPGDRE